LLRPFGFLAPKIFNYLAFKSFDFERTWWTLFQKRVVRTKFDIYILTFSNPFLLYYIQYKYCEHKIVIHVPVNYSFYSQREITQIILPINES
jgi:hypothetical protein